MNTVDGCIIRGAVQIPSTSERVTDADEEVFFLYSDLQASTNLNSDVFRGLGQVDSRKDTITVTLELKTRVHPLDPNIRSPATNQTVQKSKRRHKNRIREDHSKTVEITLAQDKTALRSRKGDTGSVLWRASVDFADIVLQQIYSQSTTSLLNESALKMQHVLELGAGTGLLAIALSPLVRHYTATDVKDLLHLLHKNVSSNFDGWPNCPPSTPGSNLSVEDLDWILLHSASPTWRRRLLNVDPVDLILVVDCIYHPSLLPALVDTIDYLTVSNQTAVLVVVELRAVDVIREFLELWISKPGWEIWSIKGMLQKQYAMWVGWRVDEEGAWRTTDVDVEECLK